MNMNVKLLKKDASNLCKTAKPSLIVMGMIFTALSVLVSFLSSSVLSTNVTEEGVSRYFYSVYNGNAENAIRIAADFQPSRTGSLISVLLSVVMWIVTAGFVIFIINTVRGNNPTYANILDGFALTARIVLLNLLCGIVIALTSLLLIVPGVIFAYGYRQALFLVIDRPDLSVIQCMKESRRMMKGHKWELFGLDLSFLGWILLTALVSPVGIWTTPYMKTTYVLYYEHLRSTADPFCQ